MDLCQTGIDISSETLKSCLDFGDLDLIFNVIQGLTYVKCSLKSYNYLLSHWLDFFQSCTDTSFVQPLEVNIFCDLDPIIKLKPSLQMDKWTFFI